MKQIILSIVIFITTLSFSQTRTDVWYFGKNAGIHISPITKNITVLNNGNIFAPATSAMANDTNGELVFYTNGSVISNKQHQFINTNRGIGGEFRKAHTAMVIPKPNDPNLYYVITTREDPSPNIFDPIQPGLYYSIVDATTQNFSTSRTNILDFPVKKLTAVHHQNGKDIWLVTIGMHVFENNPNPLRAFFSIKLTENGFEEPIITKIRGDELPLNGAFKISPDGTKIAFASLEDGIFVYNFNTSDGSISGSLNIPKINAIKTYEVFGLEFSRDAKYVYTSSKFEDGRMFVHQYDLTRNNIQRKYTVLYSSTNESNYGSLQMAIDGKIYHAINPGNAITDVGTHLGVINSPSKEGVDADYTHNAIDLETGNTFKSLPNFIQSYFNTQIITATGCVDIPTKFKASAYTTVDSVFWDFGDGNTSNETEPNHIYTSTGTFTVSAIVTYDNQSVKVEREIEVFPLPPVINDTRLVQCEVNEITQTSFDLENITTKVVTSITDKRFVFFETRADAISGNSPIPNPKDYKINGDLQELFVRVFDEKGCYSIANFFIETTKPAVEIISDMFACNDGNNEGVFDLTQKKADIANQLSLSGTSVLSLYPTALDAQLKRGELNGQFTTSTTTIWARVDSDTGCGSISPVKLIVNPIPNLSTINDTYKICYISDVHPPIILDASASNERFEWRNSNDVLLAQTQRYHVTSPGKYSVTVFKTENGIECSNRKFFNVELYNPPLIESINTHKVFLKNSITIIVNGNSTYSFSLDNVNFEGNATSYTFNDVPAGISTVYIKDFNDCEPPIKRDVTILGFPNAFTPNDDGENDRWNVAGGTKEFFKSVSIQIFNRYGKLLYTIDNSNRDYGWNGNSRGVKMASGDYWYSATLEDLKGNIIKKTGHFSLLRK